MKVVLLSMLSILLIQAQKLEMGFMKDRSHIYSIVNMGTPPQPFRVLIDLSSFHLWLGNTTLVKTLGHTFEAKQSSTYEETNELGVITTNQKGNEALDVIALGFNPETTAEANDKKFHFIILNKVENGARGEGVLGMGRGYPGKIKWGKRNVDANPRYSLVHFLSVNQLIGAKTFSMKYTAVDRGVITFGDSNPAYPSCMPNENEKSANSIYYRWNCPYYGIMLPNSTYVYNFENNGVETILFETNLDYIQLPVKQAEKMFSVISEYLNAECRIILISGKGKAMFCNNLNVDLIPDFTVKVKGFDIKLLGKEFFESYFDETIGANGEHGYISKIYGNKYNKKALKLGNSFLKYYTFIFNQDTGSVSVGDFNDIFPKGTEGASTHIRGPPPHWGRKRFSGTAVFFIVLAVIIVMFGGFILYRKRMLKRRHNFAERSRIGAKKETFIEPIGKPMVNK